MIRHPKATLSTTAAKLAAGQGRANASASNGDVTDVGVLLVTGRRREERLRDIPAAATVVDPDQLWTQIIKARSDTVEPRI